jgi:hypothetical protein
VYILLYYYSYYNTICNVYAVRPLPPDQRPRIKLMKHVCLLSFLSVCVCVRLQFARFTVRRTDETDPHVRERRASVAANTVYYPENFLQRSLPPTKAWQDYLVAEHNKYRSWVSKEFHFLNVIS